MLFPKAVHWYTSSENSQEERTVSMSILRCACDTHGQLSTNTVPLKDFPPPLGLQYINKYTGMGAKIHTKISSIWLSLSLSHTHTYTHTYTLLSEGGTKRVKVFKTTWSTKKEGRRQAPNLSTGFRVSDVSHELMQRTETRKNSNKLFCSPVRIYCLGCKLHHFSLFYYYVEFMKARLAL